MTYHSYIQGYVSFISWKLVKYIFGISGSIFQQNDIGISELFPEYSTNTFVIYVFNITTVFSEHIQGIIHLYISKSKFNTHSQYICGILKIHSRHFTCNKKFHLLNMNSTHGFHLLNPVESYMRYNILNSFHCRKALDQVEFSSIISSKQVFDPVPPQAGDTSTPFWVIRICQVINLATPKIFANASVNVSRHVRNV